MLAREGLGKPGGKMKFKKAARVVLPILLSFAAIGGLFICASILDKALPHARGGLLDLSEWDEKEPFGITGEWEFYWGRALTGAQIEKGGGAYAIVEAPGEWNYYETEFGELPGFGIATYRVRVTGARPDNEYGMRIQNMASAYRLYADDFLIAQNGTFGDTSSAPASEYRPQLGSFIPKEGSFDIILQISNDAYAVGGMWQPVIFGTYERVAAFDGVLSDVGMFSFGGLAFICLFFFIFYAAQRREKDMLILAGIGALVILRLLSTGDMLSAYIFPNMHISGFGWIDYLTLIWIQFLLYYFVYCAYGGLARKWQIIALLAYCSVVSIGVMVLPFEVITGAYVMLNVILLLVTVFVTAQLWRAAWRGQAGASILLGAMVFILLFVLYDLFVGIWPARYYILTATSIDYMGLFVAYCFVVARRYNRSQRMEVALLKNQIRPHFIHNSLTTIISISRSDPDRARDLLSEFSSYLRGYYDYDADELITLGQELELVRAYVALEQARFKERVNVEYDIGSDRLMVPPLSLQPLVENAFVHGLREKDSGGTVAIYASRTARGSALIGVRDDGVGLGAKEPTERKGVGIENINSRLSRLYRTQLSYTRPEGGGCEVSMEIPWKEADKNARMYR